jgi:hypothetical protein
MGYSFNTSSTWESHLSIRCAKARGCYDTLALHFASADRSATWSAEAKPRQSILPPRSRLLRRSRSGLPRRSRLLRRSLCRGFASADRQDEVLFAKEKEAPPRQRGAFCYAKRGKKRQSLSRNPGRRKMQITLWSKVHCFP